MSGDSQFNQGIPELGVPVIGDSENRRRGGLNRRKFIQQMALVGAAGAAISTKRISAGTSRHPRTGISNAAFMRARKRAAELVAKMTLDEKISQTGNNAPAIKRLGVPHYQYWSEALHGLVCSPGLGRVRATSFPQPLALAGTWNPELMRRIYTAISDEARAMHNTSGTGLNFYSPQTLNLHRDPRWGRCEEAPGEDPFLAATLAVRVIKGMQGDDPDHLKTSACAKHFICNNTDDDRTRVSATVDPRSFWEYYTRAYRAAVINGGVFTVMGAYNAVNGIPCCADHFLLTTLLRKSWGFRGYVTSDCDAVFNIFKPHHYAATLPQAAADAIKAGCDLNCGKTMQKHLARAVNQQLVSEEEITEAVTRILTARFLLGEFDPPEHSPYSQIKRDVIGSLAHQNLALDAARQSIILLKNHGDFLPLEKSTIKTLAVIGPMAEQWHLGQYDGIPISPVSPLDGIRQFLGIKEASPSVSVGGTAINYSGNVRTQGSNDGGIMLDRIRNRSWVEFPPQDLTGRNQITVRAASAARGGVISVHRDHLNGPRIATLRVAHTGGWENWTAISAPLAKSSGFHKLFFSFRGAPGFRMNVESFAISPYPQSTPAEAGTRVLFEPGCMITGPGNATMRARAVTAAKQADVAVLVCGINQIVDGEGHDREDTFLTGSQHELIKAVFAVNPKTVLVLNCNNTIAINWEQAHLPAIVCSIFGGQAQGTAIADVLFGNYSPGGKTCCTWYKSVDQLPPFHNYDIMKGRTYMYFEGEPLYPFGYGLSYTTFKFSDLKISSQSLSPGGEIQVSAAISNTGQRTGTEVAQLYVSVPKSKIKRPIKQLVGFARLELQPGETQRVTFTLSYNEQALWYWDAAKRKFALEPGVLVLRIGSSSTDIHLTAEVHLAACTDATLGGPETLRV